MRRRSGVFGAMILAIAAYFALVWGYDALKVLTSPTYGLEDVWGSQVVFGIGRYLGLGPLGLLKLAAALGAIKLVVAGVCAIHVVDRLRRLFANAAPDTAVLETALIVAVGVCVVSVVPAIWSQNADIVHSQTVQIVLAGLTGAFCIMERATRKQPEPQIVLADAPTEGSDPFVPWHR